MKTIRLSWILLLLLCAVSCSESDDEEADEYGNWKVRNETFFATLEDSLSLPNATWKKIKSFTKDETAVSANTSYIYVKVLEVGSGTTSPLYTDSVRVSYSVRLIPTANSPQGYLFDSTFNGDYSVRTTGVLDSPGSSLTEGFSTALQNMHVGDRWLVYVPYQLGYGATDYGNAPAYSTLIFDLTLVDFVSPGGHFTPWSSRQWR